MHIYNATLHNTHYTTLTHYINYISLRYTTLITLQLQQQLLPQLQLELQLRYITLRYTN